MIHGDPTRPDRRSTRTRAAIVEAFVSLLIERGYTRITVQDIAERANVGRSTFYAHFDGKEDLLASGFQAVLDRSVICRSSAGEGAALEIRVLELFEHLQENRTLARAVGRSHAFGLLFDSGEAHLRRHFADALADVPGIQQASVPASTIAAYLAATLMALLTAWLREPSGESPAEMERHFLTLVLPGIRAALDGRGCA